MFIFYFLELCVHHVVQLFNERCDVIDLKFNDGRFESGKSIRRTGLFYGQIESNAKVASEQLVLLKRLIKNLLAMDFARSLRTGDTDD